MKNITKITRRLMLVFLALVASSMMFLSSPAVAATDTEAYFAFQTTPYDSFTVKLTDPAKIQEAKDILSGKQNDKIHIMGRINKSKAPYNSNWDYQLDPSTIQFFSFAIEVCDASTQYVEDHLDEAGGAFLPGGYWCPWNSRLIKEVSSPVS